jgi:hypothetical protein
MKLSKTLPHGFTIYEPFEISIPAHRRTITPVRWGSSPTILVPLRITAGQRRTQECAGLARVGSLAEFQFALIHTFLVGHAQSTRRDPYLLSIQWQQPGVLLRNRPTQSHASSVVRGTVLSSLTGTWRMRSVLAPGYCQLGESEIRIDRFERGEIGAALSMATVCGTPLWAVDFSKSQVVDLALYSTSTVAPTVRAMGSHTVKREPTPGVLSTTILPPCFSTIPYETDSPNPVPCPTGLVV